MNSYIPEDGEHDDTEWFKTDYKALREKEKEDDDNDEGKKPESTIETNYKDTTKELLIRECDDQCNFPKSKYTIISPSTGEMITSVSLIDFSTYIIEYLKSKGRNSHKSENKKVKDLFKTEYDDVSLIDRSQTGDTYKTWWLLNYYSIFMKYIEARLYLKDKNRNFNLMNKINDYWGKDYDAFLYVPSYNRRDIFSFIDECINRGVEKLGDSKKLRIAFSGNQLASATQQAVQIQGEVYEPFSAYNKEHAIQLSQEELNGIKIILQGRYDRNKKSDGSGGYGTMMFFEDKKDGKQLNDNEKKIVYNEICKKVQSGDPESDFDVSKQIGGTCWICKKHIYHYSYLSKKLNKFIYLNNKAGEDEHVFPPTIGDIIGTLNQKAEKMKKIMSDDKITLYNYGLKPSHAFCNQLKSDFILSSHLKDIKINTADDPIVKAWKKQCVNWFDKPKYHSFEWVPGIHENGEKVFKYQNEEPYTIDKYYSETWFEMRTYIQSNIVSMLKDQAQEGQSTIDNLLKLKFLIYMIDLARNESTWFEKEWEKENNTNSQQTTIATPLRNSTKRKGSKGSAKDTKKNGKKSRKNTKSKGGKTRKKKRTKKRTKKRITRRK